MITDISYLEAGFSEEFSSLLNNDESVLPVDESQQEESVNNTKKHINLSSFEEASFAFGSVQLIMILIFMLELIIRI